MCSNLCPQFKSTFTSSTMNDQHEITTNAWELPSTEIVKRFGIQVDGRICFKNWSPGGEYSHKLVIKNASSNLMKISWKGCDSRLIVTRYPAPFTLPAGCHEILNQNILITIECYG
ncbi:hypothetical protein RCL1_001954 [Eukaryota sp. TZLM3-RCL]